jgi:hypothetical protein
MRQRVNSARLQAFMEAFGAVASTPARAFLVGGATAVLIGWRDSTIDIDLKIIPESDSLLRALPELKDRLQLNIELASPDDFIPEVAGWQERSRFIQQEGKLTFLHYDFYSQALAKIERGHEIDIGDVREMMRRGLVEPKRLLELFHGIEDQLHRYPAISAAAFRRAVDLTVAKISEGSD